MTDNLPVPDDLPYLNLSQSELDELRKSKKELTEYGKQRLKELIYKQDMHKMEDAAKDLVLENLTHEDMLELAEQRERSNRILQRYNDFYNKECASLPTGGPISMENLQALTLECMIDALICENMNVGYNAIAIDDIKDLIEGLYRQSNEFLKRVQEFKDSADGVA